MKSLLVSIVAAVVLVGCGTPASDISIYTAAAGGHIKAVKQHLAAGTDVNAKNNAEMTPLHLAVFYDHKEVAELLIAKGADVNAKMSGTEEAPLHLTAAGGRKEITELLIANGADVNAKIGNEDGRTPLDRAIEFKRTKTAALLRKHGGKSGVEDSIHVAAMVGNIKAVKQHLTTGADVNAKDLRGRISLHHSAQRGHKEIAELLIAKGANVNTKDTHGETPLDKAEEIKNWQSPKTKAAKIEIAELLRKHGGKTGSEVSIHRAVQEGNIEAVKQHLTAGTDVNMRDDIGATPLHWAAFSGHNEIAELLIAKGANVNARNARGDSFASGGR